jgi:multiple sugar transport system permease protein
MSAPGLPTALRPRLLGRTVVNTVAGIAVLYTLLPVLWLVLASAKTQDALSGSDILSLRGFSFVPNLRELFATGSLDAGTSTACCTPCWAERSAP